MSFLIAASDESSNGRSCRDAGFSSCGTCSFCSVTLVLLAMNLLTALSRAVLAARRRRGALPHSRWTSWLFRLRPFMACLGSKSSIALSELNVFVQSMDPPGAGQLCDFLGVAR